MTRRRSYNVGMWACVIIQSKFSLCVMRISTVAARQASRVLPYILPEMMTSTSTPGPKLMAMLQVGDGVDGERKWLAKKSEVEKRTSF